MKTCSKCRQTKPLSEFTMTSDKRLRTQKPKSWCKICCSDYASAYQQANKERLYRDQAAWREANRDQWNCRMRTAGSKRRAAKLQRVPAWYDQAKVQEIYELAAEFREAGFDVDVDHIVPLQAAEASGLHWHGNLRVCLTSHNRSKRNEMPRYHEPLATPRPSGI